MTKLFVPSDIKHVFIMKTTTREKTLQYEAIARFLGLPFHFIDLTDISDGFVVAEEDAGRADRNAEQKLSDSGGIENALRDPKSSLRKVLKTRLKRFGINTDKTQIHLVAEDATLAVTDPQIWSSLKNRIFLYVLDKILNRISGNGPGAEIGPVLQSVGTTIFFNILHAIQKRTPESIVKFFSEYVFLFRSMSEASGAPSHELRASIEYSLLQSHTPFPQPHWPFGFERYFSTEKPLESWGSDRFFEWLLNINPRSALVRQLAELYGFPVPETFDVRHAFRHQARLICRHPISNPLIYSFGNVPSRKIGGFQVKAVDTNEANIEPLLEEADALIFGGIQRSATPEERGLQLLQLLHFYSALVDRQTRSRAKHRPIIVVDDGSMTGVLAFNTSLHHRGMVKNYDNKPVYYGIEAIITDPDIEHLSDGYVDVIRSRTDTPLSPEQIRVATHQILQFRLASYVRYQSPTPPETQTHISGKERDPETITVTFYTSASNENRQATESVKAYGAFLATKGFALAYGGGDQYLMGAVAEGYTGSNGTHLTGVSTPHLLATETSDGHMPGNVDRCEIYPTIAKRRQRLHELADIEVFAWGGFGTVEEDLHGHIQRMQNPETSGQKYKIFYAPAIHDGDTSQNIHEGIMRQIYGDRFVDTILQDPYAFIDHGFVLARTQAELQEATLKIKERITTSVKLTALPLYKPPKCSKPLKKKRHKNQNDNKKQSILDDLAKAKEEVTRKPSSFSEQFDHRLSGIAQRISNLQKTGWRDNEDIVQCWLAFAHVVQVTKDITQHNGSSTVYVDENNQLVPLSATVSTNITAITAERPKKDEMLKQPMITHVITSCFPHSPSSRRKHKEVVRELGKAGKSCTYVHFQHNI